MTAPPAERSDAELVTLALAGDRTVLTTLFERHLGLLRGLCRRALGGAVPIDDAIQETLLQAMLGLTSLRQPERFGPWLGGIGLNVCRRLLRERGRADWSWDAMAGGRSRFEPVAAAPDPVDVAETHELRAVVQRSVAALPPGQRAAVATFYLRGLTYAETAAALGIEVSAVRTRLHKARRALRTSIERMWQEDEMTSEVQSEFVPVRIKDVRSREGDAGGRSPHIVVLEEAAGGRSVPIWVGPHEGAAIALLLERVQPPRPLTFRFMADVLTAAGADVREVRITRLTEDTYYAASLIEGARGTVEIDARPSDAIALALSVGAPIVVHEEIFALIERGQAVGTVRACEWTRGAAAIAAGVLEGRGRQRPELERGCQDR